MSTLEEISREKRQARLKSYQWMPAATASK